MKALPFLIIAAAILLGLQQGRESGRLAAREKELQAAKRTGAPDQQRHETTDAAAPAVPTKTERNEKPKFDSKLFLEKFQKLTQVLSKRDLDMGEDDFIHSDILDASPDQILQLPEMIRQAGISDEFSHIIYESASTRLLDKDPAAACEFSMKGGEITNFILIMRTWISRDPVAAREWLAAKSKADPPLNQESFSTHMSHTEPLDLPSLQLAASIAAAPSGADLGSLTKLDGKKLKATLDDVLKVIPPDGLPVLLKRLSEAGREDLVELALRQHPEPALAREYLKGAALPPATFAKAAQAVISQLDPASYPEGMDWYLRSTAPDSRGEGLSQAVSSWTHENSRSAAAWIATLPQGADRDRAEAAYQGALAHPRPKKAKERF